MKDLSHTRKCKYCVCKTRLEIAIDRVVIPTNFFGFVTKAAYVTCESAKYLLSTQLVALLTML